MDWARTVAAGTPGTVDAFRVRTAVQTAGRGRRGARWLDVPGAAVLTTLAIRRGGAWDPGDPNPAVVSLRVGLAVAVAVERIGLRDVGIKWPNDILAAGRKLCGVLVEADPRWFYVGIGLNLESPIPADAGAFDFPPTGLRSGVDPGIVFSGFS